MTHLSIARLLAAGAAAGAVLLGAGGPSGGWAIALADDTTDGAIVMQGNQFVPNQQIVAVGTTVTWTNTDGEEHDVLSDDNTLSSPPVEPGTTWSFTFTAPGTYHYICDLHANMDGTITVMA